MCLEVIVHVLSRHYIEYVKRFPLSFLGRVKCNVMYAKQNNKQPWYMVTWPQNSEMAIERPFFLVTVSDSVLMISMQNEGGQNIIVPYCWKSNSCKYKYMHACIGHEVTE